MKSARFLNNFLVLEVQCISALMVKKVFLYLLVKDNFTHQYSLSTTIAAVQGDETGFAASV